MQPWNQWGVQATTGYTLPGYPTAMPSPVVTVAPTVSSLPYTMGGYQWPSYNATNVTPTVGGAWPVQNQQQQWDQWTQWQQQYAQWQQEYGDKYMQSVQQSTQASSTSGTTVPVGVPPTTATAGGNEKRGSTTPGPPDAKKPKTDENSVDAIKDVLKEMAESEKQFDEQFNNWEVQFNTWREQNASHPDTEQYKAYEAKWKSWRNQLLQRREQMRKKRAAKMAELAKLEQQPLTTYSATGTVGINASMAVPPPTLGATSVASASVTPAVTPAVLPSTSVPPPGMSASGTDSTNPYALYNTSFYNQQGGYMFGSTPYGVPPVFPPVPPPAVAPTSTSAPPPSSASTTLSTSGIPNAISSAVQAEAVQNKSVDSTSTNNISGSTKPSDPQSTVNFSQPPPSTTQGSSTNNGSQSSSDSGGIPGLDLLNHPTSSQSSKPPEFNPTSTSSLIPKQQEIIQTPADSKPFDFPSPAKNQNTTVPPPSMMNFPPPGYLNPTFKVFQMGTNPNPGLLPSKHNPNKELVEALMNTIETNPGSSQDGRNQNYNMNRHQRSDFDLKSGNAPPGGQDFRGSQMNSFPPMNNFSDNQWGGNQTANKAPLLPTPNIQGFNPPGKQGDIHMGHNNNMPHFNQPLGYKNNEGPSTFRNDGPSPRFGGPQGFRGNDGPPGFRGPDGPPSGFKNDGLPPGFRADGPPPDFRSDGPPPNFRNDGPPNYRNDGSQNFRSDFRGNDGMRQNGPPGFRGNDCGPGYRGGNDGPPSGFREGAPPGFRDGPGFRNDGFRGDNIRSNDGHSSDNFRSNNFRKDDFDRPPYMNDDNYSFGKGSDKNRDEPENYSQDFNDNRSDRGRSDYNDESYDNHSDDRGSLGNQRDFRYPQTGSDSQDRNSFNDGDGSVFGRHAFGPNARPGGGPPPLMGSGGGPALSGGQGALPGIGGQRFQLPPLHNPDKIIDYIHKPANLGVPAFYEPFTMIDYAHGAHKLPEGEEDRFPPGENRDLFPKDDDYDGRLHGPGRGPSPFRSRNDSRHRGTSWGRTRESRWERDPHGSPPRRDEGRSRDREERGRDERGRDDRRDRDGRDDRHDRERRDDRDRDSRRDSRRDDRRDDRRDRDLREDKRDERGESPRREERWRHDKSSRHDDERFKDERKDRDRSSDKSRESKRNSLSKTRSPSPQSRSLKEEPPLKLSPENMTEVSHNPILLVDDILLPPGRERRPPRIVVVLRGPPGSGKTYVAKLMKDKEVEMGGSAPRILSLDDYFMVETEKEEVDKETGRTTTVKAMEYEYESGMEPHYRESLVKAFRKTVIDGYFPFIIVDCINDKLNHFDELSSFAKQKGFQVYICEMDLDIGLCVKRNVHKRTDEEIKNIVKNWEKTPLTETILDVRSLLQSASITEVNMEDTEPVEDMPDDANMEDVEDKRESDVENKMDENSSKIEDSSHEESKDDKDSKSADNDEVVTKGLLASALSSKWDDLDSSYNKLDRLDGLSKARRATSIKDWLQLPEDYFETSQSSTVPGKKRVRWADLEERREQEKMRAIGFVVGQTDWIRMLDPSGGQSKLTQTKYI